MIEPLSPFNKARAALEAVGKSLDWAACAAGSLPVWPGPGAAAACGREASTQRGGNGPSETFPNKKKRERESLRKPVAVVAALVAVVVAIARLVVGPLASSCCSGRLGGSNIRRPSTTATPAEHDSIALGTYRRRRRDAGRPVVRQVNLPIQPQSLQSFFRVLHLVIAFMGARIRVPRNIETRAASG